MRKNIAQERSKAVEQFGEEPKFKNHGSNQPSDRLDQSGGAVEDYYEIGRQEEGADAYPPLMLLLPARRASRPEGRPYCCRSGFIFHQIPNWKTRFYPVK